MPRGLTAELDQSPVRLDRLIEAPRLLAFAGSVLA